MCVHHISDKTRQFVEYAPSSGAIYSSKQIDFLSFGGPTAPSILAMGWRSLTGATMLTLLDTRTGQELLNEERPAVRSIAWNPVTVRMEALSSATSGQYKDSNVDASSARILLVVSFEDNKCVVYDATDAIHPPPPPPESEASRSSSPAGAKSTPKGTAGSVEPQTQDGEATEEGEEGEEEAEADAKSPEKAEAKFESLLKTVYELQFNVPATLSISSNGRVLAGAVTMARSRSTTSNRTKTFAGSEAEVRKTLTLDSNNTQASRKCFVSFAPRTPESSSRGRFFSPKSSPSHRRGRATSLFARCAASRSACAK